MLAPDDDWEPPSEAAMKIIEAKQERSNRISKLMSQYMLKGYRMLDKLCDECGTILLQEKNSGEYCVTCNEMTSETDKDDPAVSATAAEAAIKEKEQVTVTVQNGAASSCSSEDYNPNPPAILKPHKNRESQYINWQLIGDHNKPQSESMETNVLQPTNTTKIPAIATPSTLSSLENIQNSINVINEKLSWATCELSDSSSTDRCIQLCSVIKICSEALVALNGVKNIL